MESALLLQRMAFFTLGIAFPVMAMVSRRAAVVLAPIAVILLVMAAVLSDVERFVHSFRRRAVKATALALGLLAIWTFVSLGWSPRGAAPGDRPLNMLFALALGIVGVAALPERTRAANLNAVAVGLGVAMVLAAGSAVSGFGFGDADGDDIVLVRGMAPALILVWPVTAWLLVRGRTRGAFAAVGVAALATLSLQEEVLAIGLVVGALAFALVLAARRAGVKGLAAAAALLVLLAPALPFAVKPAAAAFLGSEHGLTAAMKAWADAVAASPLKLLTGHGFDAAAAQKARGLLSNDAPTSLLFELWHELGLVGAAAFAATLWFAMRALLALPPAMQAGVVAAYASALAFAIIGLAGFRAWWLMTMVTIVILTTAIARGQARTDRPLARFVNPSPPKADQATAA